MVEKMKVKKDSIINPFSDLSQGEILDKLIEDFSPAVSLFLAFSMAGHGEKPHRKIYFNLCSRLLKLRLNLAKEYIFPQPCPA